MYIVKTRRCLTYLLNKEVKRNRLLDLRNVPRRIGKTQLLVNKAQDTNEPCFIVEPNVSLARQFNSKFSSKLVKFISIGELEFISRRLTKPANLNIFIDEGLNNDSIKWLKAVFNVRAGYIGKCQIYNKLTEECFYIRDGF